MNSKILQISERGQITIPSAIRKRLGAQHVMFTEKNGVIQLTPVQTRDEFLQELDDREKKYETTESAKTLEQMKSEYLS
jgi:AbrB family looped-hinge helix DNA binding protein